MYSQRFGTPQREIKGPTPKVVIWRAKPPKAHRTEQHLKRIQRSYQKYQTTLATIKSNEQDRLKVNWAEHSDRKYLNNLVQAKIKDGMQTFIINTEERRNKLRELLASEENDYFTEMRLKTETIEEKKDRMREKTKLLREKKEKERQDFVAEKLEQQFREHCEELRTKLFSLHEKKVGEERKAQVAFNQELNRQKLVEEHMFAKLWEEDRLAKENREAQEERRHRKLMENTLLGLNAQISSICAQKQAERKLKEEEAYLLEENKAKVKHEIEQEKLQKQKTKLRTRNLLQKALQEKIGYMQQEYQDEQELNRKLTERGLQDLQEEADKKKQKKADMAREQKMYNDYLIQRRKEEADQEKEFDRVLEEVKAKKLAEQEEELALKKEARRRLMNEVMCTRKLQVQEKLQQKAKEQEEIAMEKKCINESLKVLNCEERENFARRCGLAQEYRKQLQMQIAHNQQAREAEKEERRWEFEAGLAANKAYLDKVQDILSFHQVLPKNIHPIRRVWPDNLSK